MDTPRITLYDDTKGEGKEITLTEATSNLLNKGFNDKCSSLRVHSGVWALYEHNNYTGDMWIVWEGQDYPDWTRWGGTFRNIKGNAEAGIVASSVVAAIPVIGLIPGLIGIGVSASKLGEKEYGDDMLSSLKPITVKTSCDSKCKVFEHGFNLGRAIEINDPVEDFRDYNFNDVCSFIRVESGTWVGYEHTNFQGPQILLPEGDHNLAGILKGKFNDRISSMRPITVDCKTELIKLEYDEKNALSQTVTTMLLEWNEENASNVEQKVEFQSTTKFSTKNIKQFRWSKTDSFTVSVGANISSPDIKKVGKVGFSIGFEYSRVTTHEEINGTEKASEESWAINIPSTIPPNTRLIMKCENREAKVNLPFKATFQEGSKRWVERGTWYGVKCLKIDTEHKSEKLGVPNM